MEKDLSETIVHNEQWRYILNSFFDYAIPLIPVNRNIGFLTRSFEIQKEVAQSKTLQEKEERYTEILIFSLATIHNVINLSKTCHSRKGGNPGKHWIPGQARNDNKEKTYVAVYSYKKPVGKLCAVSRMPSFGWKRKTSRFNA